jgi:uncharacterized protein (DUF433 family)
MSVRELRGAYTADRAAALSGVPRSTVHYWSRKEILIPSISATKVKLWSYPDLMGLRTIYWLRQTKEAPDGYDVPPSTMPAVRRALAALRGLDLQLWTEEGGPAVVVDRSGVIFIRDRSNEPQTVSGQRVLDADMLNLIEPFATKGAQGPNLQSPRPNLRIVPGKLSGSPHIVKTRIETIAVAALSDRGFDDDTIHSLYPTVAPVAITESIDLEKQLARNLRAAA